MNILEAIKYCVANPNGSVHLPGQSNTRCNVAEGTLKHFGSQNEFGVGAESLTGWEVYEVTYDWLQAINKIMQGKSMRMGTMEPGAFLKADPSREKVMYHAGDGTFSETSFLLVWIKATWTEVNPAEIRPLR